MKRVHAAMLLTALAVSGCAQELASPKLEKERLITASTSFPTICLDGVQYYFFRERAGYAGYGYMSVKFNPDSTVATC